MLWLVRSSRTWPTTAAAGEPGGPTRSKTTALVVRSNAAPPSASAQKSTQRPTGTARPGGRPRSGVGIDGCPRLHPSVLPGTGTVESGGAALLLGGGRTRCSNGCTAGPGAGPWRSASRTRRRGRSVPPSTRSRAASISSSVSCSFSIRPSVNSWSKLSVPRSAMWTGTPGQVPAAALAAAAVRGPPRSSGRRRRGAAPGASGGPGGTAPARRPSPSSTRSSTRCWPSTRSSGPGAGRCRGASGRGMVRCTGPACQRPARREPARTAPDRTPIIPGYTERDRGSARPYEPRLTSGRTGVALGQRPGLGRAGPSRRAGRSGSLR